MSADAKKKVQPNKAGFFDAMASYVEYRLNLTFKFLEHLIQVKAQDKFKVSDSDVGNGEHNSLIRIESLVMNEIEIYKAEDGHVAVEVRFEGGIRMAYPAQMVELFKSIKANISEHITNIFRSWD